jgi:D-alanine-D-alanine ligase
VIEVNPLPGLAPGYSDLVLLAERAGLSYTALIERIVRASLVRLGIPWP